MVTGLWKSLDTKGFEEEAFPRRVVFHRGRTPGLCRGPSLSRLSVGFLVVSALELAIRIVSFLVPRVGLRVPSSKLPPECPPILGVAPS